MFNREKRYVLYYNIQSKKMYSSKNLKLLVVAISIGFILLPFLWLKPGEMDLGGDGSRLYFYDPIHYLKYSVLYNLQPIGMGKENPLYLFLPFNILLIFLIKFLKSPYLIMTLFNSVHLVVAFLSMYAITKELLINTKIKKNRIVLRDICAIFVGIYYIFSPIMVRSAWDKAIFTHAQIFLNPLMFFLFLKFFLTRKTYYLLTALLVSIIFSTNFSWGAAPVFFAFYPLALVYLFLYTKYVRKVKIYFKGLFLFFLLFFIVHAFHLLPLAFSILDKSSLAYEKIFSNTGTFNAGLAYFLESARHITLTHNLLGLPQLVPSIISFEFLFFVFPGVLLVGLILNRKINYLLLFAFFLVGVFLVTANITDLGFKFYKSLFIIPGFSMFRNYYGQWAFIYLFLYSILIGFSLFYSVTNLGRFCRRILLLFITLITFVSAFPFIRGDMINYIWNEGEKVTYKVPIKMDPVYENVLRFIRDNTLDGKYLTLPFTESFNQILRGAQGGMYMGPSTIGHLTGKSDFTGYQTMFPFSQTFLDLVKEKDYRTLDNLLALLNIRYVFYNSDDSLYKYFPHFPYEHVRKFLLDRKSYNEFLSGLSITKKISFGNTYHIYEVNNNVYLPHIYIAKRSIYFNKKRYFINVNGVDYTTGSFYKYAPDYEKRTVFLDDNNPPKQYYNEKVPQIIVARINPTRYRIQVLNATKPYMLVLSESFHPNWKLFFFPNNETDENKILASYFNGEVKEKEGRNIWLDKETFQTWIKNPVAQDRHLVANAYGNSWYIEPKDTNYKSDYTFILELTSQRILYISLAISLVGFGVCAVWLIMVLSALLKKTKK